MGFEGLGDLGLTVLGFRGVRGGWFIAGVLRQKLIPATLPWVGRTKWWHRYIGVSAVGEAEDNTNSSLHRRDSIRRRRSASSSDRERERKLEEEME